MCDIITTLYNIFMYIGKQNFLSKVSLVGWGVYFIVFYQNAYKFCTEGHSFMKAPVGSHSFWADVYGALGFCELLHESTE